MANNYASYKGNKVGKIEPTPVSEADVEKEIQTALARSTTTSKKEGVSEKGDIVNIDFEGFCDGVAFDGGKGAHYDLELGSHTFIPGFEDQLIGHKAGDDVEVKVKFPEDYQAANLKGKDSIFKCHIHEVKSKKKAELNDEFAAKYGAQDVQTLKEGIKKSLEMRAKGEVRSQYLSKLLEKLISESKIEVDKEALDKKAEEVRVYYGEQLADYGMDIDSYLERSGLSKEQFEASVRDEASKALETELYLKHIAEAENINVSEEELEEEFTYLAKYYQLGEEQLNQIKKERREEIKANSIREKVGDFLFANND